MLEMVVPEAVELLYMAPPPKEDVLPLDTLLVKEQLLMVLTVLDMVTIAPPLPAAVFELKVQPLMVITQLLAA